LSFDPQLLMDRVRVEKRIRFASVFVVFIGGRLRL